MRRRSLAGVTLIELLVVVVLVGILAAVAVPSYSAYVVRGQRAAAKTALMQAAEYLERNYTSNGCYNYGVPADCQLQTGTPVALPSALNNAPTDGGKFTYVLGLTFPASGVGVVLGQAYALTATPCSEGSCPAPTSNTTFADPGCGILSLTNAGVKDAEVTANAATCWQH